jgi:hypothetical protein
MLKNGSEVAEVLNLEKTVKTEKFWLKSLEHLKNFEKNYVLWGWDNQITTVNWTED